MEATDALQESSSTNKNGPRELQDNSPSPTQHPVPASLPDLTPAPAFAALPGAGLVSSPVVIIHDFEPATENLLVEIRDFERDSCIKYEFNNRWDIVLSTVGILLSIAIVAAGFLNKPWVSAVLGAIVGAVVTAQKAFPFGSRAPFYRILIGQARNLLTSASQKVSDKNNVVDTLASLRMDYAQQLPRGSSSQSSGSPISSIPKPNSTNGRDPKLEASIFP